MGTLHAQPLRESGFRAAFCKRRRRCSRIIGSRYACTHATQPALRRCSPDLRCSHPGQYRVLRAKVLLFLACERCANPRNTIGAICTAHATPASTLLASTAPITRSQNSRPLARNRRTLRQSAAFHIYIRQTTAFCRPHACCHREHWTTRTQQLKGCKRTRTAIVTSLTTRINNSSSSKQRTKPLTSREKCRPPPASSPSRASYQQRLPSSRSRASRKPCPG